MIRGILIIAALAASPVLTAEIDDRTRVQIEALNRLKGTGLKASPALKSALLKILEKTRGTPEFVHLVRDFKIPGQAETLLDYALHHPEDSAGAEAFRLALPDLHAEALEPLLRSNQGAALVKLIAAAGEPALQPLLENLVTGKIGAAATRKEAVRALAHSQNGARFLLTLARSGELPPALRLTASFELNRVPWPDLKAEAAELLPLPTAANAEPLPPISELVKRRGDPARGRQLFMESAAACATCHQINGLGQDFGPKLSEIGTKLGKDALYQAILDPSAGISFGYEAWNLQLADGGEAFGLIVSETAGEVALKTQNGITTNYKKSEIVRRQKMSASIMPAGLHLALSTSDLVDLVEYLSSLKKPD